MGVSYRRILALLASFPLTVCLAADEGAHPSPTPAQALQWLEEGNVRFQAGAVEAPRRDETRRAETFSGGQHPFAAVLSCADSRVAPEILFDTGIGDLFVVRVAGNVADVDEIGTLEYGVEHLHTPLVVVLGHTRCGAVTAVVEGAPVPPNIEKLVDNIIPAAEMTRARFSSLKGAALVQQTIRMNVRQAIADTLKNSEIIREHVAAGKVRIVGAVYDINSGSIEWMGPHPDEAALLRGHGEAVVSTDEHAGELVHSKGHSAKPAPSHDAHSTTDAHAKPDASHKSSDAHEESHDQPHDVHPATQPGHDERSSAGKPHNFLALGGCLAGGAVMSMLTMHLTKSRKGPAKNPTAGK